ncbi:MAG: SRPBCC family protein [Acidobacteriota bacterium]
MNRIEREIVVKVPAKDLFSFHDDPTNLLKVMPSYLRVEILAAPSRLHQGARLHYAVLVGPLRFDWEMEITEHAPPGKFVDVQKKGPFHRYQHTHLFYDEGEATRAVNIIEYELPKGALAELAARIGFSRRLAELLEHMQATTRRALEKTIET